MPEDTEITIADVCCYMKKHIECPLCKNSGKVMLSQGNGDHLWKHPRPCPICRGVGMIHQNHIPTMEEIEYKMMNYFKFK